MAASIPAAIDALLAVAASALPGVQVVEGELGTYVAAEQFVVMDATGQDVPATSGTPIRYNETFGIGCLLRTYAGDAKFKDRRVRVCAMYEALRDSLVNDPSLTGTVLNSWIESYTLRTGITDKGGSASEIEFVVRCENQPSS